MTTLQLDEPFDLSEPGADDVTVSYPPGFLAKVLAAAERAAEARRVLALVFEEDEDDALVA